MYNASSFHVEHNQGIFSSTCRSAPLLDALCTTPETKSSPKYISWSSFFFSFLSCQSVTQFNATGHWISLVKFITRTPKSQSSKPFRTTMYRNQQSQHCQPTHSVLGRLLPVSFVSMPHTTSTIQRCTRWLLQRILLRLGILRANGCYSKQRDGIHHLHPH
jgi:hypothetical protein